MSKRCDLLFSFIIPTLNEAGRLAKTIGSIRKYIGQYECEILVIDNGSTDNTVEIAKQLADHVFIQPTKNIGGLRNFGVSRSSGSVIVFNDADVLLTQEWSKNIENILSLLSRKKVIIGGSLGVSNVQNIIQRVWFKPLIAQNCGSKKNYVGSAHMIMTREVFLEIGGFSEYLKTGEDYEICQNAKKMGVDLVFSPELKVVHCRYPDDIKSFFRRELWHGQGDYQNISAFFKSKTALFSWAFLVFNLLLVIGIVSGSQYLVFLSLLMSISLLYFFSHIKFRTKLGCRDRVYNLGLCYLYLFARSSSWTQLW